MPQMLGSIVHSPFCVCLPGYFKDFDLESMPLVLAESHIARYISLSRHTHRLHRTTMKSSVKFEYAGLSASFVSYWCTRDERSRPIFLLGTGTLSRESKKLVAELYCIFCKNRCSTEAGEKWRCVSLRLSLVVS